MISIVVPIFKVEDYLNRCVQSLINQTYSAIEIILVDDGSPDRCPDMCNNFAKQDKRIKVIHKENGGLSDARNCGLKAANGEYVLFVDSDDYIDINACSEFVKAIGIQEPDIVVGAAKRIESGKTTYMRHQIAAAGQVFTGEQYLKTILASGTMYMAAWLNLYRRTFLLDNRLGFKVGLLHEDEQFTPRAFLKAEVVIATDIVFYNYIVREDSITKKKDLSLNGIHIIQTCYELADIYENLDDDNLKKLLDDNLVTKYLYGFQIGKLYQKNYKNLIDKKFIWQRALSAKNRRKAFLFVISKKLYFYLNKLSKEIITS